MMGISRPERLHSVSWRLTPDSAHDDVNLFWGITPGARAIAQCSWMLGGARDDVNLL